MYPAILCYMYLPRRHTYMHTLWDANPGGFCLCLAPTWQACAQVGLRARSNDLTPDTEV